MVSKPFYKSKTLWFNAAVCFFGFVAQNSDILVASMDPETFAKFFAVVGAINVILRSITDKGLAPK